MVKERDNTFVPSRLGLGSVMVCLVSVKVKERDNTFVPSRLGLGSVMVSERNYTLLPSKPSSLPSGMNTWVPVMV